MPEEACTVRAMTEIEWLDGRMTKVPELVLGDALGESVQAELDFGFDDVLEGLWVEVRHHEPDEDSDGDPRGSGCALYAGCRYSLVEPSDLDRVFCILYEGQPRVCRVAGELGPRVGGERGRCVGIRDGGGFRKRLRRGEPRWRGLFVMLDIASQHGSTDHLRDGPTG